MHKVNKHCFKFRARMSRAFKVSALGQGQAHSTELPTEIQYCWRAMETLELSQVLTACLAYFLLISTVLGVDHFKPSLTDSYLVALTHIKICLALLSNKRQRQPINAHLFDPEQYLLLSTILPAVMAMMNTVINSWVYFNLGIPELGYILKQMCSLFP